MKIFKILLSITFMMAIFAFDGKSQVNPSSTYVPGYTRSDGVIVSGYYKTTPNNTNRDNYTTKPNVNPYTGTTGYINPDNKATTSTTTYPTRTYSVPTSTYSSPSNSAPVSTGSRGGQYYINNSGNKTYIRRN